MGKQLKYRVVDDDDQHGGSFQWVKTELEPSETNTIAIDSRAVNKSVRSGCRSSDFGCWRVEVADY
jgi:hypothetical protein